MAEADGDQNSGFRVWNIYPRISDYDRTWSLDGIAVINLIEESCFWAFIGWLNENKWPSLLEATVNYRRQIRGSDLPLEITGHSVGSSGDFDVKVAYEIRPEAAPESEPLFSAEIHWQGADMGPFEGEASLLSGSTEFRELIGPSL